MRLATTFPALSLLVPPRVFTPGTPRWWFLPQTVMCCALAVGCEKPGPSVEDTIAYNRNGSEASVPTDSVIDAYYDYSLGMGEGMRAAAQVNGALNDFLAGRSVRYFRVGDTPQPEAILDMTSAAANLMNMENFRDIGSRLQPVVQRVVANPGRQSVFVTDFEATLNERVLTPGAPKPHRIDTKAWAQAPFREWMRAGNRIDVFAYRFKKPDWWFARNPQALVENYVYTLVFTPRALLATGKPAPTSVLAFMLELHQRTASPDYQHFAYWSEDIEVAGRNDPAAGNANPNAPVLDLGNDAGPPRMDYHAFKIADVQDWLESETGEANTDRRLLNGLTIRSNVGFLKELELGLDVTDVTAAVRAFVEAQAPGAPPDTVRDKETGKMTLVDPATGKPVTAPRATARPRAAPGTPAPQVFSMVRNTKTGEIGVKLDSAFAGVATPRLYRVAVTVQDAPMRADPAAERALSLEYTGGFRVSPLAESLRLAARDVAAAMRGRVLHVSYVSFTP